MNTIKQAVARYGSNNQCKKAVEELTELSLALQHYADGKATVADVITEIADVKIMCKQLEFIFGIDSVNIEMAAKLSKLAENIEKD